jgi:small-conductance mechanosensitive channel
MSAQQCWRRLAVLAVAVACWLAPAMAQEQAADTAEPPQVRLLLDLLRDSTVQDWLARQQAEAAATDVPAPAPTTSPGGFLATRLDAIRDNLGALVEAAPRLTSELDRAWLILSLEFEERGLGHILVLFAVFVALGFAVERLFWWATRGVRAWITARPMETVGNRLTAVAIRLAFGTSWVAAFAIGSVGTFVVVSWPILLREIVLGYLLAFLAVRMAIVVGRFLLAPGAERFRIVPMSTPAARHWQRRLAVIVALLAFGGVTVSVLATLGVSKEGCRLILAAVWLVLLLVGVEAVWRQPPAATPADEAGAAPIRRSIARWLVTAYLVVLWLLWLVQAMPAFWLAVVAVGLPALIGVVRRAVAHILRPPGVAVQAGEPPSVWAVGVERGLRTILIIGAAALLADAWGVNWGALAGDDTMSTRLVRGAVQAVAVVLIADFAWYVVKALIQRKLADVADPGAPATAEAKRRARLRTLLPIVRNVVFIVLVVMVALMALSSLGVEVGPLLAGAGVVGVAIGFGAQTLVKDIIGHVLPARRCVPRRRVHPERRVQGHRGGVQPALDQAAPPSRAALLRAVRRARRGAEHEPRLGDREAQHRRHL